MVLETDHAGYRAARRSHRGNDNQMRIANEDDSRRRPFVNESCLYRQRAVKTTVFPMLEFDWIESCFHIR